MSLGPNGRRADVVVTSINCAGITVLDQNCNAFVNDLTITGNISFGAEGSSLSVPVNAFGIGRIFMADMFQFTISDSETQVVDSSFWVTSFSTTENMLLNGSSLFTCPTSVPGYSGTNWTALVQVDLALTSLVALDSNFPFDGFNIQWVQNLLQTEVTLPSNNVDLPTGNIYVESTDGFSPTGGSFYVNSSDGESQTIDYTSTVGNVFAGCTGGIGTIFTGSTVTDANQGTSVSNVIVSPTISDNNDSVQYNTFSSSDIIQVNPGDTLDLVISAYTNSNSYLACAGENFTFVNFKILTIIPN